MTENQNPIEKQTTTADGEMLAIMLDPSKGDAVWKMATKFSKSMLVPEHFRGRVDDCFIALIQAVSMGCNPLLIMQNIYIVKGKPGWSSQFLIAQANRSGKFRGSIKWRVKSGEVKTWSGHHGPKGNKKTVEWNAPDLEVEAYATLAETGEEVAIPVSMTMAQAEKWTDNEKYRSMPEVMLRYRSAALLVRFYAPETTMGLHTVEEVETMQPAEFRVTDSRPLSESDPLGIDDGQPEPSEQEEPEEELIATGEIKFGKGAEA